MRAKVIKANKSLFVLGSLRKEGMSQEEVDHLFNAIVLPNFSYALPVYGASDSDLSVIQLLQSNSKILGFLIEIICWAA